MRVDIEPADAADVDLLGVELELRRIVGVVAARLEIPSEAEGLAVSLAVVGQTAGVSEAALGALRAFYDGPVDIEVIEMSPNPRPEGRRAFDRVRLLGVYTSPEAEQVEVHLGLASRQAVGRSADRRLIGVARATMAALRALGANLPFEIEAITNLGPDPTGPVLVLLRATESGDQRLGVVKAGDSHQATVRALLHALNRHLERAFAPGVAREMAAAAAG